MIPRDRNVAITFVNYNYAFANFYENYKDKCLLLSGKTKLSELKSVRAIISAFIYEYEYTIKENKKRLIYRDELKRIKELMDNDKDLSKIFNKDLEITKTKIEYHRKYYQYFLIYLNLMGRFVGELTATFMPNTNIQKKLIRFSNNQSFFEKFTQHKNEVINTLSDFNIKEFAKTYNKLITFYYAYSLFINSEDGLIIDKTLSLVLSIYLTRENLNLINNESLSDPQRQFLSNTEWRLNNGLLFCNSKMNQSFSNYDVLPKLQEKVYVDKTLI